MRNSRTPLPNTQVELPVTLNLPASRKNIAVAVKDAHVGDIVASEEVALKRGPSFVEWGLGYMKVETYNETLKTTCGTYPRPYASCLAFQKSSLASPTPKFHIGTGGSFNFQRTLVRIGFLLRVP